MAENNLKDTELLDYIEDNLLSEPKEALALLKKVKLRNLPDEDKFRFYNVVGSVYLSLEKFRQAASSLRRALVFETTISEKALCIYDLASSLRNIGKSREALGLYKQALSLESEHVQRARIFLRMALCQDTLKNFAEAIKNAEIARELLEEAKLEKDDEELVPAVLVALLSIYTKARDDNKADECFRKIFEQTNLENWVVAQAYEVQGYRCFERENYPRAEALFIKALELQPDKKTNKELEKALKATRSRLNS